MSQIQSAAFVKSSFPLHNAKVLNSGSRGLVRVISDRGNGSYEGSLAGVRVNLRSQKQLKVGDSFIATVKLNKGVIELSPEDEGGKPAVLMMEEGNSSVEKLLKGLGLVPDSLNKHIILQMKQLEMKLEPEIIKKFRNLSLRFAGKEKRAAELLAVLKDKGLELSEGQILSLLNLLDEKCESEEEKDASSLRLINHKKGWIFLPYEIIDASQKEKIGSGNIRLLIGDDKKLLKLNLNVLINKNEYLFNLDFENKKCKKVRCNFPVKDGERENALKVLGKKFFFLAAPEIIFAEKSELEGSGCESEEFFEVGGRV